MATPDSARTSHVRRDNPSTAFVGQVTSATPHANTSTTDVRTAVARFESTPDTPTLARMAVSPANNAANSDQKSQFMSKGLAAAAPKASGRTG